MLPVQVKVISCSPCTVSDASALLERFLSSDACSDSFARDYVANLAQAFESKSDSTSAGGFPLHDETKGRNRIPLAVDDRTDDCTGLCLGSSSRKQSLSLESGTVVAENVSKAVENGLLPSKSGCGFSSDYPLDTQPKGWKQIPLVVDDSTNDRTVFLGLCHESISEQQSLPPENEMEPNPKAASPENVSKRHRRKQKHSAVVSGSFLSEQKPMGNSIDHHQRHDYEKRRKKQEWQENTTHVTIGKQLGGDGNQGIVDLKKKGSVVGPQKLQDKRRGRINQESKTENTEDAEHITLSKNLSITDTLSAKQTAYMESVEARTAPFKAGNDGMEWVKKRKEADSDLLDPHGEGLLRGKDIVVKWGSTSTAALQSLSPGQGIKNKKRRKRKSGNSVSLPIDSE